MDDPSSGDVLGPSGRLGGNLALDFVNTVDWHAGSQPRELIPGYEDLLRWAAYGHLLTPAQAQQATETGRRRAAEAEQVLRQARALREALYRILVAITRQTAPAAGDVAQLNDHIGAAFADSRLLVVAEGLAWGRRAGEGQLDALLWPVIRAAADLLTGPDLRRVRQCADADCGWFFLDTSKNGSRRWCSMAGCGCRAKARQYYRRQRAANLAT